ncbi:MAG: aldehyde dehydrogenase family protein, partial [Halomonadaceae bacterium]
MTLQGTSLIGRTAVTGSRDEIRAVNPATGAPLDPAYRGGSEAEVARACELAEAAFGAYRETTLAARAAFLESV